MKVQSAIKNTNYLPSIRTMDVVSSSLGNDFNLMVKKDLDAKVFLSESVWQSKDDFLVLFSLENTTIKVQKKLFY